MGRFLTDAVELLQAISRDLTDPRDDRAVDLAAHLFAVACRIPRECGSAPLAEPAELPPLATFDDLLAAIHALAPDVDARTLYWTLVRGLQVLDRTWGHTLGGRDSLRRFTPLRKHKSCDLTGDVVHWLRPTPALRALRSDRRQLGGAGRPPQPAPHPADNLDRLGMFWNVHQGWPRIDTRPPAPGPLPPLVAESGRGAAARHAFRIALCPLIAEAHPVFRITADGRFFRASSPESIRGRDALHAHLDQALHSAIEEGVHLVVLPELQIDRATRRHLTALLSDPRTGRPDRGLRLPFGVVAGSYHVWPEGVDVAVDPPFNESLLYDQSGRVLLRHEKRGRFRITPLQIQAAPDLREPVLPGVPAALLDDEVIEGIQHGAIVEILETGLGRLAVAICADCIAPDHTCLEPLFRELRPDLLIIVSMTPETGLFEELLAKLARIGIGCLFVNARCLCRPEDGQLLAAAHVSLFEPRGAPPTRVRWRCGQEEPEVRYYQPADGNKAWRPLSQAGESGVAWLGGPATRLGLTLDLGCHFRWTAEQAGKGGL
jgi:predicted amidohydrolase